MTINFSIGDYVIANQAFVNKTTALSAVTKQVLGYMGDSPALVQNTGTTSGNQSFIKLLTTNKSSPVYHSGNGVTLYFDSETILNSSLESSTAFLADLSTVVALNNTGSTLIKGNLVRQTGFDATEQKPIVALASASSSSTAVVLGVAMTDIADGQTGPILVSGSFQANTSGFTLNAAAYLSDTAGQISDSAGTTTVIVGRILSVGTSGTVSFSSQVATNVGSGSSSGSDRFEVRAAGAITSADNGKIISVDGGTYTMPSLADVPTGFEVGFATVSSSSFTLTPDASNSFAITTLGSAGQSITVTTQYAILNVTGTNESLGIWLVSPTGIASFVTVFTNEYGSNWPSGGGNKWFATGDSYAPSVTAMGVSIWMSSTAGTIYSGSNLPVIMGQWDETGNQRSWEIATWDDGGQFGLRIRGSTDGTSTYEYTVSAASTAPLFSSNWHHLYVVFGNGQVPVVYIDGASQTVTEVIGVGVGNLFNGTAPLVVGQRLTGGVAAANQQYKGGLDEIAIYGGGPSAATLASIASDLYNSGLARDLTEALGGAGLTPTNWWRFGDDNQDLSTVNDQISTAGLNMSGTGITTTTGVPTS